MISEGTRRVAVSLLVALTVLSIAQVSGVALGSVFAESNLTASGTQIMRITVTPKPSVDPTASFKVTPSSASINAGSYAYFNITVSDESSSSILLAAGGLPQNSVAIFTPQSGIANPDFHSSLTIVTSAKTPAGTRSVSVVVLANGQEVSTSINLQINSVGRLTTNTTATAGTSALSVIVGSDKNYYDPNSTVIVQGFVTDQYGQTVTNATVALQIDGPTGSELASITNMLTDSAGAFVANVKLPASSISGTYTVFTSAKKTGYVDAATHTIFVVNSSSTPSIIITQVYATDPAGTPSDIFSVGQTALIWVVLQNLGAPTQAVIWVQILDPGSNPVSLQLQISTLNSHGTVKVAFGFTPSANSKSGVYTVNALVSDKLISQGGTFLANADTQFALTG
jgi:hypothetical protein